MHENRASPIAIPASAGSRINAQVERLNSISRRIHNINNRLEIHTSSLGFFPPNPTPPTDVVKSGDPGNVEGAIVAIERAYIELENIVALFD